MDKSIKILLTIATAGTLALSSFAAGNLVSIDVDPSIKIIVNGEEFKPKDVNGADVMTFTYNGTTYAPLRALAEAYGLEIGYDPEKKMATVSEQPTERMLEAVERAKKYVEEDHFSYAQTLKFLKIYYSDKEAQYGVDNCGADWYEVAYQCALKTDNKYSDFLFSSLTNIHLFTDEQAQYAVDKFDLPTFDEYWDSQSQFSISSGSTDYSSDYTTSEPDDYSSVPLERRSALDSAKRYLKASSFSYEGLINQLEYTGFTHSDAQYGADNCGADWYEQAVEKAKRYLKSSPFSYEGLINQLEYTGFTSEEAQYGADNCGADWYEQAVEKAKRYLKTSSFSREKLINQLEYSGFTSSQAEYAAGKVGY